MNRLFYALPILVFFLVGAYSGADFLNIAVAISFYYMLEIGYDIHTLAEKAREEKNGRSD